MNVKTLVGSIMAVALLGLGIMMGSVLGASGVSAQTPTTGSTPNSSQSAPAAPAAPAGTAAPVSPAKPDAVTAKITQQQAEQAALAANPGSTVDHTSLQNQNGSPVYDVDFTNGGGALVDGNTGAVISSEAAGTDQGGPRGGGHGGRGGPGGADQAALAAKATVTQQQAEQAALTASPGNTVDHSRLGQDANGTVFWDVDFANGGGVTINAQTGAVIATEAAGTDHPGGHGPGGPPSTKP